MNPKIGQMFGSDAMLLRTYVGECKVGKGALGDFELAIGVNMAPLIKSRRSGVTFSLSWKDLVDIAIERGIDKPGVKTE